jgi:hypothetical protein
MRYNFLKDFTRRSTLGKLEYINGMPSYSANLTEYSSGWVPWKITTRGFRLLTRTTSIGEMPFSILVKINARSVVAPKS